MVIPQRRDARFGSKEKEQTHFDVEIPEHEQNNSSLRGTPKQPPHAGKPWGTAISRCHQVGFAGLKRLPACVAAAVFTLLVLLARNDSDLLAFLSPSSASSSPQTTLFTLPHLTTSGQQQQPVVDAAVFIVMGDLAKGPAARVAVEALRVRGAWQGPVVLLTDNPACLRHLNLNDDHDPEVKTPFSLGAENTGLRERTRRRSLGESSVVSPTFDSSGSDEGEEGGISNQPTARDWERQLSSSSRKGFSKGRAEGWGVTVVEVTDLPDESLDGKAAWILAVKAVKCRLFELVNENSVPGSAAWQRLLYLDVDVWAAQPLAGTPQLAGTPLSRARRRWLEQEEEEEEEEAEEGMQRRGSSSPSGSGSLSKDFVTSVEEAGSFLAAVALLLPPPGASSPPLPPLPGGREAKEAVATTRLRPSPAEKTATATATWVALFADCAAHAIGWCSGCDAWNTGVMVLARSRTTDRCLARWRQALESGEFPTDQEALEAVVIHGRFEGGDHLVDSNECGGVAVVPRPGRHLLFLKDYLALPKHALLTGWPTFVHVTAANRLDTQDALYTSLASFLHRSLGLKSPFGAAAKYVDQGAC